MMIQTSQRSWPSGGRSGLTAPHNDPIAVIRQKQAAERDLLFVAEVAGEVVGTLMAGYDGHRGWL